MIPEEFRFSQGCGIDGFGRACRQQSSDALAQHHSGIFNQESEQSGRARMNSVMEERTRRRSYGVCASASVSEFLGLIVVPVFISWIFIRDGARCSVSTGYSL